MKKPHWTEAEVNILKNNWTTSSRVFIQNLLPMRSWNSMQIKAARLGISGRSIQPYKPPFDRLPTIYLNDVERSQLAMMVDCEGTIGIRIGIRYCPYISMTNTDENLIKLFKTLTKTSTKISYRESEGNRKPRYDCEIASMPRIYVVLKLMEKYLIVKSKQAKLLQEFIEIQDKHTRNCFDRKELCKYTPRQRKIVQIVIELNMRGI